MVTSSSSSVDSEWPASTHSTAESTAGWRKFILSNKNLFRNACREEIGLKSSVVSLFCSYFFCFVRLKLHGIIGQL